MRKTWPSTTILLLELSQLSGGSCPHFISLSISLKLFYYIWTILNYSMYPTVVHLSEFKWQRKGNVCVKEHWLNPSLSSLPLWLVLGSRQRQSLFMVPRGKGQRPWAENCSGTTQPGWQTNSLEGGKPGQEIGWLWNAWMYEERDDTTVSFSSY